MPLIDTGRTGTRSDPPGPRQDRPEPRPVAPPRVVLRLAVVHHVDDVIEEPRQNQLRIGIADTDGESRWP